MKKPKPTRTTNPIHFEDLDPKRFEDLIRELIYDFKDWQSIEATGRGGTDNGFDIRAYERLGEIVLDDEGIETVRPMDGNLWMIQCKREKVIGPTKLRKILEDIDPLNPPYGYVLAASVNFTKTAYDTFREELKARGVMEFYLWGKADLEAQLHLPKNDRILFTFFGVSYYHRRRSRATEIRFGVSNKNRIMRAFGDQPKLRTVLVRDSKDDSYPYSDNYPDFSERPRWKEYQIVDYHPLGLVVETRHNYAYYDEEGCIYDIAKSASLIFASGQDEEDARKQREEAALVRDYWENFPKRYQAEFHAHALIRYDTMVVIDDKGDTWNDFPHIFVDFEGDQGPFRSGFAYLMKDHRQITLDDLEMAEKFPKTFPEPVFGVIHDQVPLSLPDSICQRFVNYGAQVDTLYDLDGKLQHLGERDVGLIRAVSKEDAFLQVTHRFTTTVGQLLESDTQALWNIQQQIGREPAPSENVTVLEIRRTHKWQFAAAKKHGQY